jgi:hypothetical protein
MSVSKAKQECKRAYDAYERRYEIKKKVPDAVWDFPYIRPEKPKTATKIANYGLKKKDRKFPYYSQEFIGKMESKEGTDEYMEFIEQEWDRRINGFFFYNGDRLEWITGHHYCMLQYWKIQATKKIRGVFRKGRYQPDFRDSQRDIFYAIDYARKDENCAGLVYIAARRSGKTNAALSEGYWDTTENPESKFCIQSKTQEDAKNQFKKLVDSWKKIPVWFKPSDTEETTQSNKLWFGEKKRSGQKVSERVYKETLDSIIYPVNSKEEALDGEYVSYYFGDELGKASRGLDIEERWNITRECLFDGNIIVGFGVNVTTVEDMDKYGSESFKRLWDKSDTSKRMPNGMTESYLYQFFLPAYYGYTGKDKNGNSFVDEFGYSNISAAKKYHEKEYNARKGESLLSYQRKYPLSIDDCWVTTDSKNNFSTQRLIEQRIWNSGVEGDIWVRGNFMWKGGKRWTEVDFYPDNNNGRWMVCWQPNLADRNKFDFYNGTQKRPTRTFAFTGVDPFSHEKVVDEEQGSNGAAVTILKSYGGSEIKEGVVCVYNYRQADPNAQVEDIIMQCVYYSSPALIESNISFVLNAFKDKGYYGYAEMNPLETRQDVLRKGKKGYPTTSKENVENIISHVASYILDRVGVGEDGRCGYFPPDLVDQCLNFNPAKRGPYDLVMALGLAVILARNEKKSPNVSWTFEDWMPSKVDIATYNRVSNGISQQQLRGTQSEHTHPLHNTLEH